MSWAAVAVAAASAIATGITAYSANKTASDQAEADADAAKASGRLEAERIRKEKNKVQSAARAAAAENGLSVNEGTAVTINDKIEQDAQYDAAMSEVSGFNTSQRLKAQASVYKSNANSALATGAANAASSGYGAYKSGGWK